MNASTSDVQRAAKRLEDWDELEGKTIRCVISNPAGPNPAVAVIVFEDDDWCAIVAENGPSDEDPPEVDLLEYFGRHENNRNPGLYLSPEQQLKAGLINRAQHELLKLQLAEKERADKAKKLERLKQQAAELQQEIGQ